MTFTDPNAKYELQLQCLRQRYHEELLSILPVPVESIGIDFDHLFGEKRFLGEYYCLWVADILGIIDQNIIEELGVATILGRMHTILSDCMVDQDKIVNRSFPHLSEILLVEFLRRFQQVVPDASVFWKYACHYMRETARTDTYEYQKHWNCPTAYDECDMAIIGQKTSTCFIPVVALSLIAGREDLIPLFVRVIETRNVAVQIRDDIADWREDIAVGNYTLPLSLAFNISGSDIKTFSNFSKDNPFLDNLVAKYIYLTGIIEALLNLSNTYLAIAQKTVCQIGESPIYSYLNKIRESNDEFQARFGQCCGEIRIERKEPAVFQITTSSWPTLRLLKPPSLPSMSLSKENEILKRFDVLIKQLHPQAKLT